MQCILTPVVRVGVRSLRKGFSWYRSSKMKTSLSRIDKLLRVASYCLSQCSHSGLGPVSRRSGPRKTWSLVVETILPCRKPAHLPRQFRNENVQGIPAGLGCGCKSDLHDSFEMQNQRNDPDEN